MKLLTLIGGSAMAVTWAQLGGFGHVDDALVLLAAAFSITEVSMTRSMWRFAPNLALGPAIAVKPWAIIFVPALLWAWWRDRSMPEHGQRVVGGVAVTFGVAGAAWLPFVLLAPHTLDSLRPTVSIAETSVLGLIGTAQGAWSVDSARCSSPLRSSPAYCSCCVVARLP